ncbi:MAG: hypothetical protein RR011_06085, partial [Oscillospiraceae bacterium]
MRWYAMTKTLIKKKLNLLANTFDLKDGITVVLCFLSLFAKFDDIPLCFLPLLFLQLARGLSTKFICLMLSVITFGVGSAQTAYYVPYIAFMTMYFMTQVALKKSSIKPEYVATAVFVLSKAYVLTFRYSGIYWVIFAAECVGLIFLEPIVRQGLEIIEFSRPCREAQEIFAATCAFLLLALSFSGIRLWGINAGAALLLCLALSYSEKSNSTLSLLSILCMFFCLSQSQYFAFLFAGFLAIYLVGVCISKTGIY